MTFGFHDTAITCTTLHSSLEIVTGNTILWPWYTLYSLFGIDILYIDLWSYLIESHIVRYLYWLIKSIKQDYWGRLVAGKIRDVCLEEWPLVGLMPHVLIIYAHPYYYMLHDTWVQWIVSPCYQDLLTHHLFDMQLSCGMRHKIVTLV